MAALPPGTKPRTMKTITLWQPWASLVALGVKTIETRSWSTPHRGALAIHAAARVPPPLEIGDYAVRHLGPDRVLCGVNTPLITKSLPLGAVVAVSNLIDAVPIVGRRERHDHALFIVDERDGLHLYDSDTGRAVRIERQRPYGDFSPGRWGWLLGDVEAVDPPVPEIGRRQLWDWPTHRAASA